jgi:hypothetical protein
MLVSEDFRFPTEMFSLYGVEMLLKQLREKKIKAYMIPELLVHAFHVDLTTAQMNNFEEIRLLRNDVTVRSEVIL